MAATASYGANKRAVLSKVLRLMGMKGFKAKPPSMSRGGVCVLDGNPTGGESLDGSTDNWLAYVPSTSRAYSTKDGGTNWVQVA